MTISAALASVFGRVLGGKLKDVLAKKPNGAQRLDEAAAAMSKGLGVLEALKSAFGNDFLPALTEALGGHHNHYSYEGGINSYIKLDHIEGQQPLMRLRDELNINLDRVASMQGNKAALKNHFRGAMQVWQRRYWEIAQPRDECDARSTFKAINGLLEGAEDKSFEDVYNLGATTALGGAGTLMVISGVCLATGTGVGIVTAITTFLFGIPWISVGALVLPGVFLVGLAAIRLRDDQAMSVCVQLAYRLLERAVENTGAVGADRILTTRAD